MVRSKVGDNLPNKCHLVGKSDGGEKVSLFPWSLITDCRRPMAKRRRERKKKILAENSRWNVLRDSATVLKGEDCLFIFTKIGQVRLILTEPLMLRDS